jgi:hypothetical protein
MQTRELTPQRCPCLKEGADRPREHGVTVSKLADTRFKASVADLANLETQSHVGCPGC